ncbi:MAG: response regulator transcription factor [Clostridiales bacterium]|nr:response regulator transcription factor [Clostridiales bacterium]
MRVVICEDETICSDLLRDYVKRWAKENGVFIEIFAYKSAEEFIAHLENDMSIDLLFLDIRMRAINGLELAYKLRNDRNGAQIVFTTDSTEYVFEGYNVSALNYLVKPLEYRDCRNVLNRVHEMMTERKYYLCKTAESFVRIPHEEIMFIEMNSHNAIITTCYTKYITRKTMSDIISELDSEIFMRCHKSYIVNIQHILSISQKRITLSNNICIDASSKYAADVSKMYVKYYSNRR